MRTPWGDIEVADAHVHFFSHRFFELLAAQGGRTVEDIAPALGWRMPPENPVELARDWVRELDVNGVSSAALIASLPGDHASVAAAVRAYPGKFLGYFMANPLAPDAVETVASALDDGLRGVCLFPAMHRYSLHSPEAARVVDLAAARPGTVVFIHCGVLTVGVRAKLGLPSPFDMRFSNPLDVHGLAMRHPGVRFVIPHFGAGMLREALMTASLCPNVWLDTSSSNSWMRFDELTLARVYQRALAVVGPSRLLFGTDSSFFPRGWHRAVFDQHVEALSALAISVDDASAIFGGNYLRLWGSAQ